MRHFIQLLVGRTHISAQHTRARLDLDGLGMGMMLDHKLLQEEERFLVLYLSQKKLHDKIEKMHKKEEKKQL